MDRYDRLNAIVVGLSLCTLGWCVIAMSDNAITVCAGLACLVIAHFVIGYVNGGR